MGPILVKLPDLSTAILPSEQSPVVGYFTDMELRDILAWIDAQLPVKGLKDDSASKLSGHPYAIQNMRKTLRNGRGSLPKAKTLADIARVLGSPPHGLKEPVTHTQNDPISPAPPPGEPTDLDRLRARRADVAAELARIDAAIAMVEQIRQAG